MASEKAPADGRGCVASVGGWGLGKNSARTTAGVCADHVSRAIVRGDNSFPCFALAELAAGRREARRAGDTSPPLALCHMTVQHEIADSFEVARKAKYREQNRNEQQVFGWREVKGVGMPVHDNGE